MMNAWPLIMFKSTRAAAAQARDRVRGVLLAPSPQSEETQRLEPLSRVFLMFPTRAWYAMC